MDGVSTETTWFSPQPVAPQCELQVGDGAFELLGRLFG